MKNREFRMRVDDMAGDICQSLIKVTAAPAAKPANAIEVRRCKLNPVQTRVETICCQRLTLAYE
jgi:hypothetical protein